MFVITQPPTLRLPVPHPLPACLPAYLCLQVLSTRIYRGEPPQGADSGIEFVAFGGVASLIRAEAHEMGSAWEAKQPIPQPAAAQAVPGSAGASILASPRHVLHPAGAGGSDVTGAAVPAAAAAGGISEAEFQQAVALALAEGGAGKGGGAGGGGGSLAGSLAATPKAGPAPFEEVVYCISPHAAAY